MTGVPGMAGWPFGSAHGRAPLRWRGQRNDGYPACGAVLFSWRVTGGRIRAVASAARSVSPARGISNNANAIPLRFRGVRVSSPVLGKVPSPVRLVQTGPTWWHAPARDMVLQPVPRTALDGDCRILREVCGSTSHSMAVPFLKTVSTALICSWLGHFATAVLGPPVAAPPPRPLCALPPRRRTVRHRLDPEMRTPPRCSPGL